MCSDDSRKILIMDTFLVADEKNIDIVKQKESRRGLPGDISVSLGDELEISGGMIGGILRLTGIDGYILDIPLSGNLLIIKNADQPGVVGHIGTVLGEYAVNIGSMEVGRKSTGACCYSNSC